MRDRRKRRRQKLRKNGINSEECRKEGSKNENNQGKEGNNLR
jgi:hypothetical protein